MSPIAQDKLAAAPRLAEQITDSRAERGLGDIGERRSHSRKRPRATDVGERDEKSCSSLHLAEASHHRSGIAGRRSVGPRFRQKPGEFIFGIEGEEADQTLRIGTDKIPKIWGLCGDACKQGRQWLMVFEQRLEGFARRRSRQALEPYG